MMDDSQMDPYSYQALVSLNNTGAILLQRNRFEEAYLTFMDALHVFENGFSSTVDDNTPTYRCSLQAMVTCATMRLDATDRYTSNQLIEGAATSVTRHLCGDWGAQGTGSVLPRELLILRQESIYLNYQSLQANDVHIDLTSSVVVYNFALCHLKMALFNQNEKDYFYVSGVNLMKYAFAALPPLPPFTEEDDFTSVATMSIITLSFLVDVCVLPADEMTSFRDQLRRAKEGLEVFAARSHVAPAA